HCSVLSDTSSSRGESILRKKLLIYTGAIAIFFLIAAATGTAIFFSSLLTHYIESDAFRVAMENETAKGLHFPSGRYAPIQRTGSLTAGSESFQASNGEKTLRSIDDRGSTGEFNALGMFVRRWRFDKVRVLSDDV